MRRLAAALVLTALALPALADDDPTLVFSGVTVVDGKGGRAEGRTVVVSGGKIGAIGTSSPKGRVINVKGAYLSPGFIDPASRAGWVRDQAERTREMTSLIDVTDLVNPKHRDFKDAVLQGCTTVVLAPGAINVVGGLSRVYHTSGPDDRATPVAGEQPRDLCLTLATSASSGNFPPRGRPTTSIYARRPNTRMGVVWLLRQAFLAARGDQPLPGDPDLSIYREVQDGTRRCRVFAHRAADITAALRVGKEVGFKFTLESADEGYLALRELEPAKVPVIVGPLASVTSGTGPDFTDTALLNARKLKDAGLAIAFTAGDQGGRWLREQALFAVRHGFDRDEALTAVTGDAAKLAGITDRGVIETGKAADVVLWSDHPLKATSRVLVVVIGGHVVLDRTRTPDSKTASSQTGDKERR